MDDTTDGPALEPLPKTYRKTPALSTYRCRICKSDKHRPWFVLVEDESYLLCGLCHRKESELSLVAAPQPAMPVPSPNPMQESTLVEAQASNQGQARVRGARKHRSQKKQKQVAPLKIGIVPRGGKSNVTARPSPHAQLTQATVRRRRSKRGHEAAVKALDISPSPSNFVGGSVLPEVHLGEPLVGAQNLDATGQSVGQQESAPAEGGETRGEGKLEEGGESDPVVMEENMRGALGTAEERGVSSGARRGRWRSRKSRDSAGAGSGLLTSAGGAPVYGGAEGPVTMSKQGTVGENKDRDGKIGALSETDGASAKPVSAGPAEGPVLNDEKRCADCGRTASKRWREDVKGGVKCEKCNKQGNEKSGGARPGRSAENGHVSCDEVDLRTPGSSVQKPVQAAKERGGSRGKEEEGGKRKLSFGEAEPPRKRQKAAAAEAEVGGVGLDGELVNRRVGIWWPLDKV